MSQDAQPGRLLRPYACLSTPFQLCVIGEDMGRWRGFPVVIRQLSSANAFSPILGVPSGAWHASCSPPGWVRVRSPHIQLIPVVRGRRFMASPDEHTLMFLRGSGFLLSLVGVWDLLADASSPWPSQKGFLIFKETKIIAVIERNAEMRRGVEGTYSVEGNRIIMTGLSIDTAPEQGAPGDGEFEIDGDILTITWLSTNQTCQMPHHVDKFRRRAPCADGAVLPPVAIYESDAPNATSRR